MSDEEIYFDNEDDEQENIEDIQGAYEEDILDTPDKLFEAANNSLGIDDYYSIDLLYKVYVDEEASDKMKIESLKSIAKAISQHPDDLERIINVLSDVFYAYQDGLFTDKDLNQVVASMISNLSSSRDALSQFLESAESQVNKSEDPTLYAEIKLRQFEIILSEGQYEQIEKDLEYVESLIPYSPDTTDYFLRSTYFRLIILKINIAEINNDEEKMISLFEEAKKINQYSLTSYQNAVFCKMEGIVLKRNRDFYEAKNKFYDAFKFYDDIGDSKRIDCIKYCALCEMANHDLTSIFNSSRVSPYKDDANIILIFKIDQAYLNNDIATFAELIEPVSKLYNNEFDIKLLNEVRLFVLRGAIWKFSRNYKNYDIKYAAERFSSDINEVKQIIMDLILSKDLNALLNPENDVVTVIEQFRLPLHLLSINPILTSLELSLMKISNENDLDY